MEIMLEQYRCTAAALRLRTQQLKQELKCPTLSQEQWQILDDRRRLLLLEIRDIEAILEMIAPYVARAGEKAGDGTWA